MNTLADLLKSINIKVYGYTARKDLQFDGLSTNMTVNGSGFMLDNNFTIVNKRQSEQAGNPCIGDCKICNKCKYTANKEIQVTIH